MSVRKRTILSALAGLVAVLATTTLASATARTYTGASATVKVAVLLPGSRNDHSWNSYGYAGIQAIAKQLHVKTGFAENVADADEENALRTFANQGFNLIFGHTDRFQQSMLKVAPEFAKTTFVAIAGTSGNGKNVNSVDIGREQYGYLEGYIAGKMTKTNTIGVVSGLQGLPVTVATVGGFRLGVHAANPKAKVRVVYLPSMEDAAAAKQATLALIASQADGVFPFLNAGVTGVVEGAKQKNAFTFGRSPAQTDLASKNVLTNTVEDWSLIYVATAKLYLRGKLKGRHQHFGFDTIKSAGTSGAAVLYKSGVAFNPIVPKSVQSQVKLLEAKIGSGALKISPTKNDARSGA